MFLEYNAKSLFQLFQNKYISETGNQLIIGSEEYTIISVFVYVLAVLASSANRNANNRFIETAQGEHLDAIASGFGLYRSKLPDMNARIDLKFYSLRDALQVRSFELAGVRFNGRRISGLFVTFEADAPLTQPSPSTLELQQEIGRIFPLIRIAVVSPIYPEGFYTDENNAPLSFPYTLAGDAAFREYIKTHNALTRGTAAHFEQVARDLHPNIIDARTIRQGEQGFVPGDVKILVLTDTTQGADHEKIILDTVKEYFTKDENHLLGQDNIKTIPVSKVIAPRMGIAAHYPDSFFNTIVVNDEDLRLCDIHFNYCLAEYNRKILKIGAGWNDTEFIQLLCTPITEFRYIKDLYPVEVYEALAGVAANYAYTCSVSDVTHATQQTIHYPAFAEVYQQEKSRIAFYTI